MFTLRLGLIASGNFSSACKGEPEGGVPSRLSALATSCFLLSEAPSLVIEVLRFRFLGSWRLVDAVRASINMSLSCSTIAKINDAFELLYNKIYYKKDSYVGALIHKEWKSIYKCNNIHKLIYAVLYIDFGLHVSEIKCNKLLEASRPYSCTQSDRE